MREVSITATGSPYDSIALIEILGIDFDLLLNELAQDYQTLGRIPVDGLVPHVNVTAHLRRIVNGISTVNISRLRVGIVRQQVVEYGLLTAHDAPMRRRVHLAIGHVYVGATLD